MSNFYLSCCCKQICFKSFTNLFDIWLCFFSWFSSPCLLCFTGLTLKLRKMSIISHLSLFSDSHNFFLGLIFTFSLQNFLFFEVWWNLKLFTHFCFLYLRNSLLFLPFRYRFLILSHILNHLREMAEWLQSILWGVITFPLYLIVLDSLFHHMSDNLFDFVLCQFDHGRVSRWIWLWLL